MESVSFVLNDLLTLDGQVLNNLSNVLNDLISGKLDFETLTSFVDFAKETEPSKVMDEVHRITREAIVPSEEEAGAKLEPLLPDLLRWKEKAVEIQTATPYPKNKEKGTSKKAKIAAYEKAVTNRNKSANLYSSAREVVQKAKRSREEFEDLLNVKHRYRFVPLQKDVPEKAKLYDYMLALASASEPCLQERADTLFKLKEVLESEFKE